MPPTAGAAASGLLTGSASLQLQQQLPTHAVGEATDSLGLSELPAGLSCIEEAINETHLLQVCGPAGQATALACIVHLGLDHSANSAQCTHPRLLPHPLKGTCGH